MMSKIKQIGLIAEDVSDIDAAKILIKRISQNNKIGFKKFTGNGCGTIRRKAFKYAVELKRRGCDTMIFIHDLDRNILNELREELSALLNGCPFNKYLICIPIEEIEAWFLSDPKAMKKAMKLKKEPKINAHPESIKSPKEKLEEFVYTCSEKEKIYLNTVHNKVLAEEVNLELVYKKCPSFSRLHDFIKSLSF